MNQLRKFSSKYLLTGTMAAMIFFSQTWKTAAHHISGANFYTPLTGLQDTTRPIKRPNPDSLRIRSADTNNAIIISDTVPVRRPDSSVITTRTDTFSLKLSRDTLDAPVHYEAEDSAVVLVKDKKIILYGKTLTEYKDITLTAPKVELDQRTSILTAVNSVDSTGYVLERAHFKQGINEFQSDTISFNFKTQRGLTKNTYTQQDQIFINSAVLKKVDSITIYAKGSVITTCNLDHPHFAFKTNKLKVINNKVAVSGPTHPEFEGVPVPVYLPFGFFPLNRGRHSGFLPPQFTANEDFGLGLEGLGYYKVLNDYVDVTLRGNIYSYGGWSANFTPSYRKRYRYNGAMNFSIQSTKIHFKGDPDFVANKSYFVNWNHSVDSRARPGTNFSASVQAGSTKYNEYVANDVNRNFQNMLGSSIVYSKTWAGKPYNLSLSANHNQNNLERLINLSLPDVGFTVSTLYPFQPKKIVGTPKWYEKLGIGYNGVARSQISFYDTAFSWKQIADTLQWGAQHNIPITLSLPPLGSLMVAPSISYAETWMSQKDRRMWNNTTKRVDTFTQKGFYTDRTMQFGLGLSTAVFGTFNFRKGNLMAIRHSVRPSFSINYKPDLSGKHFYDLQIDSLGNTIRVSEFNRSIYGYYAEGEFGGIGIQLDNNLEMKKRSKKDSSIQKVRLIDGFGLNTGYNFLADSMRLSPIQLYLRSTLFEKINITASATLDPYEVDSLGRTTKEYAWENGGFSLGRLRTANIAISTQFQSESRNPEESERRRDEIQRTQQYDPAMVADQQRLLDYMRQNPSEFVDFNIPWSLGLSFALYYTERYTPDYKVEKEFSANLNFNGSFSLTPKWNFSANGYFDFDTKELQTFTMSINREMHCWQMSIGVTPVGLYRYFNITISPKSSLLQDLKINRTRTFSDY